MNRSVDDSLPKSDEGRDTDDSSPSRCNGFAGPYVVNNSPTHGIIA